MSQAKSELHTIFANLSITNLSLDSRQVGENTLFLAYRGQQCDGRDFIESAINNEACGVLLETDNPVQHLQPAYYAVPSFYYYQLGRNISKLAGDFYANPSYKLSLVGVTGTNGKTTITQLLAQWVNLLAGKSVIMGTNGNGFLNQLQHSTNTTGSPLSIQQTLADLVAQKATFCAMEISSHGLHQHRVDGLAFDSVIFSNLSRDHLDYHHTMEAYALAKKRLFTDFANGIKDLHQIINADDPVGASWLKEFPQAVAVSLHTNFTTYNSQWLKASHIQYLPQGAKVRFQSSWGDGELHSPLIGEFNVINLLLAMATLLSQGYSLEQLIATASKLQGVCGRMEMLALPYGATAIVDYAHTPDALAKALEASRLHCYGKLWCVVGCGGDRDQGKRPMMAKIATDMAEAVIFTDDNPRSEDPKQIMADMLSGVANNTNYQVIHNRQTAIEQALSQAQTGDVILIAGKGHEDYQIIGTESHYFSDQEVVKAFKSS